MFHSVQPGEGLNFVRRCAQWWQNWNRTRRTMVDLDRCGPAEAEHIARDLNVSGAELRVLASRWPDDLLSQRLGQLNLDAAEIVHTEPQVLRDLSEFAPSAAASENATTISPIIHLIPVG
jgi:hypothetical protein